MVGCAVPVVCCCNLLHQLHAIHFRHMMIGDNKVQRLPCSLYSVPSSSVLPCAAAAASQGIYEITEDILHQPAVGGVVILPAHSVVAVLCSEAICACSFSHFQWQHEGESTTPAQFTVNRKVAIHQFCQAFRNGKAQTRTTVFAGGGRVGLCKALKYLAQLFG